MGVPFFFGWDAVVAEGAPGVAAEEAAEGEPQTTDGAVNLDGLYRVVGAGRFVTAGAVAAVENAETGGDEDLIEADGENEEGFHHLKGVCR